MDINNNITQVVIPFIASILGIALPILIQVIERIDSKYQSTRLVNRIKREWQYKMFIYTLIGSIVLAFYHHFLAPPPLYENWVVENSSAILLLIFTIVLITSLFMFINIVLIYYDPARLQNRILQNFTKQRDNHNKASLDLKDWTDLTFSVLQADDKELGLSVYQTLYDYIIEYRKGKALNFIEYEDYFYNCITSINEIICRLDKRPVSINNNNDILRLFLDGYQNTRISQKTYTILWRNLSTQLFYNLEEWLLEYWIGAHQHFMFNLKILYEGDRLFFNSEETVNENDVQIRYKERADFLEFHYAFCSLLLYKGKYKLLGNILSFTNSEPPRYELIPSSLSEILTVYMSINKSDFAGLLEFEQKYFFQGLRGVNNSGIIKAWIEKYLALLIIRLYNIRGISYRGIWELPAIPEEIRIKAMWIEHIPRLVGWISQILNNTEALQTIDIIDFNKIAMKQDITNRDPISLLNNFIETIRGEKVKQELSKEPDQGKIEEFNSGLLSIIKRTAKEYDFFNSLRVDNISEIAQYYIDGRGRFVYPTKAFFSDADVSYVNVDDTTGRFCSNQFRMWVSNTFMMQKSIQYNIKAEELFEALDQLNLDENYIVICFDIYMNYYKNKGIPLLNQPEKELQMYRYNSVNIINLNSGDSHTISNSVYILRKSEIPFIEYIDPDEEIKTSFDLIPLDEKIKLYSKIIKCSTHPKIGEDTLKQLSKKEIEESVLVLIEWNALFKWLKNIDIVCLKLVHQIIDNGSTQRIDVIMPFKDNFKESD